ncbi:glyceraldehyde-3-phosphate dehydrogenase [Ochrobactrum sp. CM-21-5]|nr:glyceraldehyde-3-phosphate dehydrogenase [Ochrobactrum sp. CM-21-5]MBC2886585.1 glyceraldehyde-3-phosphate dehydrogenase [Ochrobactrum sp. CM-21-5]
MKNLLLTVPELTPFILELDTKTETLDLSLLENQNATSKMDNWQYMRSGQTVHLLLNDVELEIQTVTQDPSTQELRINDFKIPSFSKDGSLNFIIGSNTLQYKVVDPDGSQNPNTSFSKKLEFRVIRDKLSAALKIDITQGAAGYTDDHPDLMPANIAVVRGVPNTEWKAHGKGRVRFQDLGGSETCIFSLDENGVCPLVLIRLDKINYGAISAAVEDEITITYRNDTTELLSKPVVFGDYQPLTGDAAEEFKSISFNNVGISDNATTSIFSIIMQETNIDKTVFVQLDYGLSYHKKTLNTFDPTVHMQNNVPTPVVNKTVEFAVSAAKPGKYKVVISSLYNTDAIFTKTIEFRDLA